MIPRKRVLDTLVKGVTIGLLLSLGLHLALYLVCALSIVFSPFQYDYGEGFHWFIADLFSRGGTIYQDINQEPYITAVYTPVYYLLSGGLIKVFGSSLVVGRLVSMVSALLVMVLMGRIVYLKTQHRLSSIVGSLLFLTVGYVAYWTLMFRVDTLALLFGMAGVYLVVRYEGSSKVLWSVPFFVLSIYTKQMYVAAPIATGLYLLLTDRRTAFWFSGLAVALGGAILGVATWVTGGQFFAHTFMVGSQPMNLENFKLLATVVILGFPAGLAVAIGYVVVRGFRFRQRKFEYLGLYFLVSTVVCLLLIGKQGAWLNYAMEVVAIGGILTGLAISWMLQRKGLLLTVLSLITISLLIVPLTTSQWLGYKLSSEVQESYEVVSEYIQETEGTIISENATLLMMNGRKPIWEPSVFCLGGYAYSNGEAPMWDQEPLVRDIEARRFPLVILDYDLYTYWLPQEDLPYPKPYERLTPEMARAFADNYVLKDKVEKFWVYEPRGVR